VRKPGQRTSASPVAAMVANALIAAAAAAALGVASAAAATPLHVQVPFRSAAGTTGVLTVAVASGSSFRLGVDLSGAAAPPTGPIVTPMVAAGLVPSPAAKACTWGGMSGLCAPFGALLASPSGTFALYDADNATLLTSSVAPAIESSGIVLTVESPTTGALHGQPEQPCLSNGMFGPPFAYSAAGKFLAFAVSEHDFDDRAPPSQYVHCAPSSFSHTPDAPKGDTCAAALRHADSDASNFVRSPNEPDGRLVKSLDECCAACNADYACHAWIATENLEPDESGRNCWPGLSASGYFPAANRVFAELPAPAPAPPGGPAQWWILADEATGNRADWCVCVGCVVLRCALLARRRQHRPLLLLGVVANNAKQQLKLLIKSSLCAGIWLPRRPTTRLPPRCTS
jgi:hypothetical protein